MNQQQEGSLNDDPRILKFVQILVDHSAHIVPGDRVLIEATKNPIAKWKEFQIKQTEIIEHIEGHDKVDMRGPNVDLALSIKGQAFKN